MFEMINREVCVISGEPVFDKLYTFKNSPMEMNMHVYE